MIVGRTFMASPIAECRILSKRECSAMSWCLHPLRGCPGDTFRTAHDDWKLPLTKWSSTIFVRWPTPLGLNLNRCMRLWNRRAMKLILLGAIGRAGREVLRGKDWFASFSHPNLETGVGSSCDPEVLEALLPGVVRASTR